MAGCAPKNRPKLAESAARMEITWNLVVGTMRLGVVRINKNN
jgi:hypothetical protein